VSSVTNITGNWFSRAKRTALRVLSIICSIVQPSAYWRIGLDPMKAATSIGIPTRCEISTTGRMSTSSVRAAQSALIPSR